MDTSAISRAVLKPSLAALYTLLTLQVGCASPASDPSPKKDVEPEAVEDTEVDVAADLLTLDLALPDATLDCPGAAGCDCQSDSDCNSGLCTEVQDGKRCGVLCASGCPASTVCRTANTVGEPINYCAPVGVRQCAPCLNSADCNAPWSAPAVCASGGTVGSFCASTCIADADCPSGLKCQQVDVSGDKQLACAPTAGVATCTCSDWAATQGSATSCSVTVEAQLCPGTRACGEKGLSDCVTTPGAACVDVGCQGAKDGTVCDDGDPCTQSECNAAICKATTNLCQCQADSDCPDDANLCNGAPICDKGALPFICKTNPATVVSCTAADEPCTALVCQPATGKCESEPADEGKACNDGDPCFANKTCKAGQCQAGLQTCACVQTSDCAVLENGDLCDGTLYCDQASHTCKVNPVTVVKCLPSGKPCEATSCVPATGQCVTALKPDAVACQDGAACTVGDYCQAGQCIPGTVTCDCATDADCAAYEDGNSCNGKLFCNKAVGKCQVNPKTVVQCPSGLNTECQLNSCDPTTGVCGLSLQPTTTLCEDGNPCSGSDHCDGKGSCISSVDICLCDNDAECAGKDDGDLCNGTLYCEQSTKTCQLNPATVVHCPWAGDNPCAPIQCQPPTGECQPTALDKVSCDDGDPCTALGLCQSGTCADGPNLCQCQTAADCEPFDDDNPCNGIYYCDLQSGECKVNPASIPGCTSSLGDCTSSICSLQTGQCEQVQAADGTWCSDGESCSKSDTCLAGTCKGGTLACACLLDSDCAGQEDGNACNGVLICDRSEAVPQCVVNALSIVTCTSDTLCLEASCEPATGICATKPVSGPCSDGNACTVGDGCATGECLPEGVAACDDQNVCTDDSCNPGSGCVFLSNAVTCSDGSSCTLGDVCVGGACLPGSSADCDDSNICTDDTCKPSNGCVFLANTATCSDGDACMENDGCMGGSCSGVTPINCNDNNPCTVDDCNSGTGCIYSPQPIACDDGNACTENDFCTAGVCVSGAALNCEDDDEYSQDLCDPLQGCLHPGYEICNGEDDDGDGGTDNVVCGGAPCLCQPNETAVCAPGCTVCPDVDDVAIAIDDGGVAKVICAHDQHAWGMVPAAPDTLTALNANVVVDSRTGLHWQRAPGSATYNWVDAKSQCDSLVLDGKSDWRAPTVAELESIVDYTKNSGAAINVGLFADTDVTFYWTWILQSGSSKAWRVAFNNGATYAVDAKTTYRNRCVR